MVMEEFFSIDTGNGVDVDRGLLVVEDLIEAEGDTAPSVSTWNISIILYLLLRFVALEEVRNLIARVVFPWQVM